MKKHLFLILVAVTCFHLFGCDSTNKSNNSDEVLGRERTELVENLITAPKQEKIVLLSIKYGQNSEAIEKAVHKYLMQTDFDYILLHKKFKDKNDSPIESEEYLSMLKKGKGHYSMAIKVVSNEFEIDPQVFASIIIEYKYLLDSTLQNYE